MLVNMMIILADSALSLCLTLCLWLFTLDYFSMQTPKR